MSNTTKVVNLINFHGITMFVVENEGVQYISVKPLADMAEIDWRGAKRRVFEMDNVILYGTKHLQDPVFVAEGGLKTPPSESVYIRLDRSHMYLARVQTGRMRANGKEEAAEKLLALQIEWAEALHSYETNGVAYKKSQREDEQRITNLFKTRNATRDVAERQALTEMIHQKMADVGYPVNKAATLFDG